MQILHIPFSVKFTLFKYVLDVPSNDRTVTLKQFCHLRSVQPYRIIHQRGLYLSQTVLGPIHDDLALVLVLHQFTFSNTMVA